MHIHTYIHTWQNTQTYCNINKSKNFKTTPEKVKSKTKQQQQKVPFVPSVMVHAFSPGMGKAEEGDGFHGNHPSLNSKFQVNQGHIIKPCPKPKPKPKQH